MALAGLSAPAGIQTLNGLSGQSVTLGPADLTQTSSYRFTTDAEKSSWNAKEPAITAGSTSQYLRGDKSLSTFSSDVLATLLAGLSTASSSTITSSDSTLSGMGKLQAQISANTTSISGKEPSISSGTSAQLWRGDKTWVSSIDAFTLTGKSTVDGMNLWQSGKAANYGASGTSGNTVLGRNSGTNMSQVSTLVYGNTLIGDSTGAAYTATMGGVTAVGWHALTSATGDSSTALGFFAGGGQTTGSQNVWIGGNTGQNCLQCIYHTAVGNGALYNITTNGQHDTAVGMNATVSLTTGDKNIALGEEAGYDQTTGDGGVFLGYQAGKGYGNASNKLYIANIASDYLIMGDFSAKTLTLDAQVSVNKGTQLTTTAAQPSCNSGNRGLWWVVRGGAGVADVLQICMKDAADAYGWVTK